MGTVTGFVTPISGVTNFSRAQFFGWESWQLGVVIAENGPTILYQLRILSLCHHVEVIYKERFAMFFKQGFPSAKSLTFFFGRAIGFKEAFEHKWKSWTHSSVRACRDFTWHQCEIKRFKSAENQHGPNFTRKWIIFHQFSGDIR